jgi:small subunit ribosomal protein S9
MVKKAKKVFIARGKRKESIARATLKEGGSGIIRINSYNLDALSNKYIKNIILEPFRVVGEDLLKKFDISINVKGGGQMGQAQAAAVAISRALITYDSSLKDKFLEVNRALIVEDPRRVEPKKYKGPKARARFQKSYR